MQRLLAAAFLAAGLAACGSEEPAGEAEGGDMETSGVTEAAGTGQTTGAVATLRTAEREAAGTATASEADGMVRISLMVQGLPPGTHGVHVHMTGRCEAPTFESAGGHWNPTDERHGLEAPEGQHAGDMPNLDIGEDGRGTLEYTLQGGTFTGLLDGDGSAFVVHASADDQVTDPSGNSGDRIACGVFERQN